MVHTYSASDIYSCVFFYDTIHELASPYLYEGISQSSQTHNQKREQQAAQFSAIRYHSISISKVGLVISKLSILCIFISAYTIYYTN